MTERARQQSRRVGLAVLVGVLVGWVLAAGGCSRPSSPPVETAVVALR